MKSFLQFFTESQAVQQAARMGLTGDGHGGWYKDGEFVAKTEKGQLKFYNKRQKVGKQDPPQSEKEKRLSHTTSAKDETPAQVMQKKRQEDDLAGAPLQQKDDPEGPVEPEDLTPPRNERTKGTLTIAFGRFNPPTTGHEKLLDTVASSSDDGDYVIVPSRSQDKKKNPLDADQKVAVMRQMFPNHSEKIVNDPANRTIFDVLKKAHNDGYTNVRMVVGADRQKEFDKLTNNYNGLKYDFDKVEVRSAGDRDPDGEGVEGMSASKQRKYAAENDFENFLKGVPSAMNKKVAKELFKNLRTGMNIKEGWNMWEIAPLFDWKNLREHFVGKKIYQVGDFVENLNTGLIGKIIRRGANHLICVTEDKVMFKSWIQDVAEAKVPNEVVGKQHGVPASQREIGTDSYLKYAMKMVPGSAWGKQFINKYRKK